MSAIPPSTRVLTGFIGMLARTSIDVAAIQHLSNLMTATTLRPADPTRPTYCHWPADEPEAIQDAQGITG